MKDIIRKLAAMLITAAMITAFTPLFGFEIAAYAEGEEDDPFAGIQFFELEQCEDGPSRVLMMANCLFNLRILMHLM